MINLAATVKISLRALKINKMRSALTMLGIVIGVTAVIIMVAIGSGARERVSRQISSAGSNLLVVVPGSMTAGGIRMGFGTQANLTTKDAEAILKECPAVWDVSPEVHGAAQVVFGNQNWSTAITATTPSYLNVRDWLLDDGRNFSDQDIRNTTKVCIVGQTIVENLFAGQDPIDQIIRIKKVPFVVIGVLEAKGQDLMGQDQDDMILIPITTGRKKVFGSLRPDMVRSIIVKTVSTQELPQAETQIQELLRQRHHIGPKEEEDFTVRNLTQMLQMAEKSTRIMTMLLGAIASISLLVGGIGIMNIMLVSVTERTREIGIRMAVGAKVRDIRLQFITEALILSMIGGAIGIIMGIAGAKLIALLTDWSAMVSLPATAAAFGFSGLVGIFFGFYPAYKASLLNPIEALRYE